MLGNVNNIIHFEGWAPGLQMLAGVGFWGSWLGGSAGVAFAGFDFALPYNMLIVRRGNWDQSACGFLAGL